MVNPKMALYFSAESHPSHRGWWAGPEPHGEKAWVRNFQSVGTLISDHVLTDWTVLNSGEVGGLDRVIHGLIVRTEAAPSPIPQGFAKAKAPGEGEPPPKRPRN